MRAVPLDGDRFAVTIENGRVTCQTARSVLRAFMSDKGTRHAPPNGPACLQTWTLDGCHAATAQVAGAGYATARTTRTPETHRR